MTTSIWKITFSHAGGSTVLTRFGERIADELKLSVKQSTSEWSDQATGWGGAQADGKAMVSLSWTVFRVAATQSLAAVRNDVFAAASAFPTTATGTLTIEVEGGATWVMNDVVMTSFDVTHDPVFTDLESTRTWAATGGRPLPTTPIELYQGMPWEFILHPWETLTTNWENF